MDTTQIPGLPAGRGGRNPVPDVITGTGRLVEGIVLRTLALSEQAVTAYVFPNGTVTTCPASPGGAAAICGIGVPCRQDTDRIAGIMEGTAGERRWDLEYDGRIVGPREIFGVDAFKDCAVITKARQKTKPVERRSAGRSCRRRQGERPAPFRYSL